MSSSRITSRGRLSSASTRNSRWRSPPLRPANGDRRRCASPNCSRSRSPSVARRPENRSTASETRSRSGSPESCSWLPTCFRSRSASRTGSSPKHPDLARVLAPQALEDLDRRGLPGAVGADQSEDLAVMDGEVEVVDDRAAVVGLGESANGDDRLGRVGERCDVPWPHSTAERPRRTSTVRSEPHLPPWAEHVRGLSAGSVAPRPGAACRQGSAGASRPWSGCAARAAGSPRA